MSMPSRREYLASIYARYRPAPKAVKTRMLDEFCASAGYRRKYAIRLLNGPLRRALSHRHGRGRTYTNQDVSALRVIWRILDYPCGQRLKPMVPEMIRVLERCHELVVTPVAQRHLTRMSAKTMDRRLAVWREEAGHRLRGTTKPGSLLKSQIPIALSRWDETRPGYAELDLVAHCGMSAVGDFVSTLNVTDLATGWTEAAAFLGKAQHRVMAALRAIEGRLPFKLLGLDPDNGSEFINWQLFRYCLARQIAFTRGRPGRGNDNAHIEEKNWTHVRKVVGYGRLETPAEAAALNALYAGPLRLYMNCFQPVMKLKAKTRLAGRLKRTYDTPRTPFQRVINSSWVPAATKATLLRQYETLNPVALKREIEHQLKLLWQLTERQRMAAAKVTFPNALTKGAKLHFQMT